MALQQRKHILFVEDDADTRGATTAMLEHLGYRVSAKTQGLKALNIFSKQPYQYDLALVDHGMADMTGLELASRLRRIRPEFPVVVYTGYFDRPSSAQLKAAGMGGRIIIKPATVKELGAALQDALGGSITRIGG